MQRPRLSTRVAVLWLASLIAGATRVGAQGASCGPPATYDACALRLEGKRLVQGRDGRLLGTLGPMHAPNVAAVVAGVDSAVPYAIRFDRGYSRGARLIWTGALLQVVPLIALASPSVRRHPAAVGLAVVPGAAVQMVGAVEIMRAHDALESAVWWYNRGLSR